MSCSLSLRLLLHYLLPFLLVLPRSIRLVCFGYPVLAVRTTLLLLSVQIHPYFPVCGLFAIPFLLTVFCSSFLLMYIPFDADLVSANSSNSRWQTAWLDGSLLHPCPHSKSLAPKPCYAMQFLTKKKSSLYCFEGISHDIKARWMPWDLSERLRFRWV